MQFTIHQSVKILGGKWAGAVGTVEDTRAETSMVKVLIEGVFNSEPLSHCAWFKASSLEVL